jgi:predicted kinase
MKKLIVMRGVPGSGKSTLARELADGIFTSVIYSTDDFFMKKGEYRFNSAALGHAHAWNLNRVMLALIKGIEVVIVDNTHTRAWEARDVVEPALLLGYEVEIREPATSWAFDAEVCAKKTLHDVPEASIRAMIARWEHDLTVDQIMASSNPYANK